MTDLAIEASPTQWVESLRDVAMRYDSWIVDQWGVLHNGVVAYPGAADTLRRLEARGDTVIILSNSGKCAAPNGQRLAAFGIDPTCYTTLITSGDVAREALVARDDPYFAALGPRCWLVSNNGDRSVVDGLPIEAVASPATADFVLLCGVGDAEVAEHYDREFAVAASRGLPMICANPDIVRLTAAGLKPSCGAFARRYEAMGGAVRWLGKPYPEVYRACLRLLGLRGRRATAVVGDSLDHDVAGGHGAGLATVFVTGGIHAAEFAQDADRDSLLRTLCRRHGLSALPDIAIPILTW